MPNPSESPSTEKGSEENASRLGKFIQTYHGFLSSFVIGAAGLIATTIWQYRQAGGTARQTKTHQQIAQKQTYNTRKNEHAGILPNNPESHSAPGAGHRQQPCPVLLSPRPRPIS